MDGRVINALEFADWLKSCGMTQHEMWTLSTLLDNGIRAAYKARSWSLDPNSEHYVWPFPRVQQFGKETSEIVSAIMLVSAE
jgi:hypothetical protein